tara:strand:- start:4146 stop:4700 length:555 start_codon:yes stop_codon:yes gene_type:complete
MSDVNVPEEALALLEFWWAAGPGAWFNGGAAFDQACEPFRDLHEQAARGDLDHWEATPSATLALLLLLDQLPRNLHRGSAKAFATDAKALGVSERALERSFDKAYPMPARNFYYLPFMHSEDLAMQERSLDLYRAAGVQDTYFYAFVHYDAVRRFGRFPHRNAVLGRETTEAEEAYLASGGFSA